VTAPIAAVLLARCSAPPARAAAKRRRCRFGPAATSLCTARTASSSAVAPVAADTAAALAGEGDSRRQTRSRPSGAAATSCWVNSPSGGCCTMLGTRQRAVARHLAEHDPAGRRPLTASLRPARLRQPRSWPAAASKATRIPLLPESASARRLVDQSKRATAGCGGAGDRASRGVGARPLACGRLGPSRTPCPRSRRTADRAEPGDPRRPRGAPLCGSPRPNPRAPSLQRADAAPARGLALWPHLSTHGAAQAGGTPRNGHPLLQLWAAEN
jgi:hypothetical protein